MKNFLLKNLWLIISLVAIIICFVLSTVWIGFFIGGCLGSAAVCLFIAYKTKQKYNKLKDYSQEDEYFDARKYDYDEDVYYIGDPTQHKKEIGKNIFSRLSGILPTVVFSVFGIGFLSIGLMCLIKLFI